VRQSGLLSLLDVKELPLAELFNILNNFHTAFLAKLDGRSGDFRGGVEETALGLKMICGYIGVSDDLLHQIENLAESTKKGWISDDALFILAFSVIGSVNHLLERPRFKVIENEKLEFFNSSRALFGEAIIERFPASGNDIEEAGKCYAAGRDTACVFHLMRVMEIGLRTLGASLKDTRLDPKRNPSWEAILKKCDEELGKALSDRAVEWREDDAFYSTATANLRVVKDAWRNPTMHVDQTYTEETALDVWNAVRAFMRHISSKLSAE